jgi:hypothetical protein
VSFLPEQVIRRQLTIQGIHNYAARHLQAAVRFLAANHQRYPFDKLVTNWIPLDHMETALAAAMNQPASASASHRDSRLSRSSTDPVFRMTLNRHKYKPPIVATRRRQRISMLGKLTCAL